MHAILEDTMNQKKNNSKKDGDKLEILFLAAYKSLGPASIQFTVSYFTNKKKQSAS